MKILGVELRQPTFNELTASAIMAAGLWLACVAFLQASHQPLDRSEAGGALLVIFWGCVGARLGIRIDRGVQHLALNVLGGAVLLGIYHGVVTVLG